MEKGQLGRRIATIRRSRGLTGEQLGEKVGLGKDQVSRIESGQRGVEVTEAALIAEALGTTLQNLLSDKPKTSLALAARVMDPVDDLHATEAQSRARQVLECEAVLLEMADLPPMEISAAGQAVIDRARGGRLQQRESSTKAGTLLADITRDELGLGRTPVAAQLAELAEQHFGIEVAIWPTGTTVSGLCAHGDRLALAFASSSFVAGHVHFTVAHELAHHLFADTVDVTIDLDLYGRGPNETRANAFAAALLLPKDGVKEFLADRPINEQVLTGLMRKFEVSYQFLLNRLETLHLLAPNEKEAWLARSPSSVLRTAGDPNPSDLTAMSAVERIPPRLWSAAQLGYEKGRVGIGVLAGLRASDAESTFDFLQEEGVSSPQFDLDLADI